MTTPSGTAGGVPLVGKPCEMCDDVTVDRDDPAFTGRWLCYWCHCSVRGFDHKERLNWFAEMFKPGQLVPKAPGAASKPEGSSLWTTPVAADRSPLENAKVDPTVTREKLQEAAKKARERAKAFSPKSVGGCAEVAPDYIFDVHDTHLVCRRSPAPVNVGSRFEFHGMGEWFVVLCRISGKPVTVQYRDARGPQ